MTPPVVSIIIPTYNGRELTLTCLRSLRAQRYPAIEVIVVDNGSQDGTAAAVQAQFPEARCVANPANLGFVGGCNRGAQAATGEFLLFLNNDTTHDPEFLVHLIEAMRQDPDAGLCGGKVLLQRDPRFLDAVGSFLNGSGFLMHVGLYERDADHREFPRYLFSPKGVGMVIPRGLFERLGRFDELFFAYFDESDLAWRVWLSGATVIFVPQSRIYHATTSTAAHLSSSVVNFHAYKNRLRSLIKNLGPLRLSVIVPTHVALCLVLVGLHLLQGQWGSAGAILRAIAWNVRQMGSTWRLRRLVQGELRQRSDRDLFQRVGRRWSWPATLRLYRLYVDYWDRQRLPARLEKA